MKGSEIMATHRVMDQQFGDRQFDFDPADADALAEAVERFNQLLETGYTAAEKTGEGKSRLLRQFRIAEEVVFFPRLEGG
jgi:hypothetical protein